MEKQEDKLHTQEILNRKTFVETKILPVLTYIGLIGAVIASIAYIIVVMIMITGFKVQSPVQTIVFASVNALVGIIIMMFLKVQGIALAKDLPCNKKISDKYYQKETKDKKYKSLKYFWITSSIKDIITKGLSLAITSAGIIYIMIKGSGDYNLLLLAIFNLLMFACFGLLSLNKAYDFYNTRHVPYMAHQLQVIENKEIKKVANKQDIERAMLNLYDSQIGGQNVYK